MSETEENKPEVSNETEEKKFDIDSLPVGDIGKHKIDASKEMTTQLAFQDVSKEGDEHEGWRKYEIIYHRIPWKRKRQVEFTEWNKANGDKDWFLYNLQVEMMQEVIDKVGGVVADTPFWDNIDPQLAESIREFMYGDSPIASSLTEAIQKNLLMELIKGATSGKTTSNEKSEDKQETLTRTGKKRSSGKQRTR